MDAPESPRSPLHASPAARLSRARQILEDAGRPSAPDPIRGPRVPAASTATSGAEATTAVDAARAPADPPAPNEPDAVGRSTRLALAVLSGAVRPFATATAAEPSALARLRTRLMTAPAPGEASRLELGALGAALVGAAFVGSTIPGAQPVGAQPQPVAAVAAAIPAAAAAPAAAASSPASDTAADTTSSTASSAADTTAVTDTAASTAATGADTAPADSGDTADDPSGDAGDGSDPLAGGGSGTTLARVALITVHGDAPVQWATAPAGSAARKRAATGTTFTGLAALPGAPLATGLSMIAGQAANPATRAGCTAPSPVTPGTTNDQGVTTGTGCDYPAETPSLPGAVARDGRTWKAYVAATSQADAAAKLCRPADAAEPLRAYAQRSALGHLGDLTGSGACEAAAAPLSALAADLASDAPPAWLSIDVGDCGTDGCDAAEAAARDADLDAALAALAAAAPADGGKSATFVVSDGDVPGLAEAPAGSFPATGADADAPKAVITGALLIGDDVTKDSTDPLALDPFAIARTQATWLGLTAPGLAAAEGVTALALPGA